jgi:hypothetical protein
MLHHKRWQFAAIGFSGGLAMLNYSYFLLFPVAFIVFYAISNRVETKRTVINASYLFAGLILPLLPIILRNIIVGIPPLSLASNAGITFITANCLITDPYASFYIDYDTLHDIMSKTGGKAFSTIIATLKTHPDAFSYLSLIWLKLKGIFAPFEIPNNINYYFIQRFVPSLNYFPIGQGILAPLGITGLLFFIYNLKWKSIPMVLAFGVALFPMIYFSGLARHRIPLMAVEIILAAYLIHTIVLYIRVKNWMFVAVPIALTVGLFFWVKGNDISYRTKYDFIDYKFVYDTRYFDRMVAAEVANDWDTFAALLEEFINARPEYIDDMLRKLDIKEYRQLDLVKIYADVYGMYATSLERLGKIPESRKNRERSEILRERQKQIKAFFEQNK